VRDLGDEEAGWWEEGAILNERFCVVATEAAEEVGCCEGT
jgi:hypothetical protein